MVSKLDTYSTVCQIGKGACGSVYLVRSKETKKLYALKKIELDESRKTRTKKAVQREARIMAELCHPHIVQFHDSFFDDEERYLWILQDYCDGGTLEDKIIEASKNKELIPEKLIIQWFLQIALAVRYMHSKKVLHRDLKTQNIFLNKSATVCKLGDFGIAKELDNTMDAASTCVGTPCYLSPEMCQDIPYSSKADVWALGCLLYEMCSLKPAFDAHNLVSLFYKIVKAEYEPIPDEYSDDMHDLISTILVKHPDERPSARGVLVTPFLRTQLLAFVEEKEFILKQRKLPTRQGTRPYTTPNLRILNKSAGSSNSSPSVLPSQQKRALSCRPNIAPKVNSIPRQVVSAPEGRVSPIPEEFDARPTESVFSPTPSSPGEESLLPEQINTPMTQVPETEIGSPTKSLSYQESDTTSPSPVHSYQDEPSKEADSTLESNLRLANGEVKAGLNTPEMEWYENTKVPSSNFVHKRQLQPSPQLSVCGSMSLQLEMLDAEDEGRLSEELDSDTDQSLNQYCDGMVKENSDIERKSEKDKGTMLIPSKRHQAEQQYSDGNKDKQRSSSDSKHLKNSDTPVGSPRTGSKVPNNRGKNVRFQMQSVRKDSRTDTSRRQKLGSDDYLTPRSRFKRNSSTKESGTPRKNDINKQSSQKQTTPRNKQQTQQQTIKPNQQRNEKSTIHKENKTPGLRGGNQPARTKTKQDSSSRDKKQHKTQSNDKSNLDPDSVYYSDDFDEFSSASDTEEANF